MNKEDEIINLADKVTQAFNNSGLTAEEALISIGLIIKQTSEYYAEECASTPEEMALFLCRKIERVATGSISVTNIFKS